MAGAMSPRMSRRALIGATSLALTSCAGRGDYFGTNEPPREQRLVFQIGDEPDTLDPSLSQGGSEEFILPSLFEGLLTLHPHTNELRASLATHYRSEASETRFT